jgi:bile acid:Na+ symporter, BASS family
MKELILSIVKIGLPLSVVASMFAQGLSIAPSQLAIFKERPWLMLRSLVLVLFLVPMAVLGMILLLKPSPAVAIGLAILVACPAAPMMLVKVPKKGGSLAYMASLHLSLALLALLTVPITLYLLLKALGFQVEVGEVAVARVVGMTILLPVGIGILIRFFFPKIADRIGPALAKVGGVVLLILVLFVVAMTYGLLMKMEFWSYLVMGVAVAVSIAIGHWLGPRDPEERTTLAMESAARHPGLAMTIAALNFSPQKALPVLVPYLVVFMVVTTVYLQWRKWRSAIEKNSSQ